MMGNYEMNQELFNAVFEAYVEKRISRYDPENTKHHRWLALDSLYEINPLEGTPEKRAELVGVAYRTLRECFCPDLAVVNIRFWIQYYSEQHRTGDLATQLNEYLISVRDENEGGLNDE